MFFILSKTIHFFLMPISLVLSCFLLFILLPKRVGKWFLRAGIALFIFFSLPFISTRVMRAWETPPTPIEQLSADYKVGIVLTGITNLKKSPHDRTYFNKGADRLMHAVQLYKKGIIEKILVTGGHNYLEEYPISEADELIRVLHFSGVQPEDILAEPKARNTYENAVFSAQMLEEKFPEEKYLLITSAFHMYRSKACFDKAGVKTTPFSTDFYTTDPEFSLTLLLPSEESFLLWRILFHEWLGIAAYKLKGYI